MAKMSPELFSKFSRAINCVISQIGYDLMACEGDDAEEYTPAEIMEVCIDADRMNPTWSGACQGISDILTEDDYKQILKAYADSGSDKELLTQMLSVCNYSLRF